MLCKRVLTAAVGIPVFLFIVNEGGLLFLLTLAALTFCGMRELLALFPQDLRPHGDAAYLSAFALLAASYFPGRLPVILFLVLAYSLLRELGARVRKPLYRPAATIFGALYIGWLFGHFYLLRNVGPKGFSLLLLALVATWITDSAAYFVGCSLGRHKLAPTISPTKSIEGAVGGFAFAVAFTPLLASLVGVRPLEGALIGLIAATFGEAGDLVESSLKRQASVKDSGRLFPGHGGLLDRFDSLLFAIPGVYYVLLWLRGLL